MQKYYPAISDINSARRTLNGCVNRTPLTHNKFLSERYGANIYLKREDLQIVRSYKLRGAYNKIASLTNEEKNQGITCASAGNHAQGVAYSCKALKIRGKIFMPITTPKQKVNQVKVFGEDFIEIILTGDTFDECAVTAIEYCNNDNSIFVHPFDDPKIIEGQGTVAVEIIEDSNFNIDYLFVPIGGGGLISGVGSYFKEVSPLTKIIGVEPMGAASMKNSIQNGVNTTLSEIDKFVDGAAVKRVGELNFEIAKMVTDEFTTVPEGRVCTTILEMYNSSAIVVEPAGALSIAVLDQYADKIRNKNIVCVVSGGNNDISRNEDFKERSLLFEGLKHYFIVEFPQRAGALRNFVSNLMGANDDITYFEYKKKTHRERGPAVIGIELTNKTDFPSLIEKMDSNGIKYTYLNDKSGLFEFLI